jgi:AraC-like DNA-binding protein
MINGKGVTPMENNIHDSISFIETRLTEPLTVDELAERSYFSKTHYQRLFRAIVGEPVMEYIKNRRLQLSCRELLGTHASVLDIALKYGYDSHEGFTRAFKSYFGVTPSDYRKTHSVGTVAPDRPQPVGANRVRPKKEEQIMLTPETITRITQNIEQISAKLTGFADYAVKLAERCHLAVKTEPHGIGASVVADELNNLAGRVIKAKTEFVTRIVADNPSAFGMMDVILKIVKVIDDISFQTNLLRAFHGVEVGRMGDCRATFEPIHEGYETLCAMMDESKETIFTLIENAVALLHTDIQKEIETRRTAAADKINAALDEGAKLAADAVSVAAQLDKYGKGFLYIANGIAAKIESLKESADNFDESALKRLEDCAFYMNVAAFNAAIESARAGGRHDCAVIAERIKKFASTIQKACKNCYELLSEFDELTKLTERNVKRAAAAEKWLDDIRFQSDLMLTQLALEAERSQSPEFRALAKTAEQNHIRFTQTMCLKTYAEELTVFLDTLKSEVGKHPHGGGFAYFVTEYQKFLGHISA